MKIASNNILSQALVALFVFTLSHAAPGALVLEDRNSTVQIDPTSSSGTFSWLVDGNSVLAQQWFWYRVAGDTQEHSINTIGAPETKLVDGDFDPGFEKAVIKYSNQQLTILIEYNLKGGGLGTLTGDIAEQISIQNHSGNPLALSFFQYSDFNLSASDQVVIKSDLSSARQSVSAGLAISETVNTPAANFGEAGLGGSTLSNLQDAGITNLNGNLVAGPGNVTWALQWDLLLTASGPGSEILISKDKQVLNIPEPELPLLTLVGSLGWLLMFRRRAA